MLVKHTELWLGAAWGRSRAQLYLAACGELPGNTTHPGHLHKAQLWQGKGRLILDVSIHKAQIAAPAVCSKQQPTLLCWPSRGFGLDTGA